MLRHLLDTNICIDVIKRRPQELLDTFNHHAGQMAISAITFSKLINGVEKSAAPARNLAAVEDFCRQQGPGSALAAPPARHRVDRMGKVHQGRMRAILEPVDPAIRGALAALERAAEDARRIAIQTDTELIVMRNGQICSLPPEEIAKLPPVVES
jgi:predicted nucleic acid-binding protein